MDGVAPEATFADLVARPLSRRTHVQPVQHPHAPAQSPTTTRHAPRTTIFAGRSAPRGSKSHVEDWLREIILLMWMQQALAIAFQNAPRTLRVLPLRSTRVRAQAAACTAVIKDRLLVTRLVESKATLSSGLLLVPRRAS